MEVGLIECNQVRTGRSHRRVEHMGVIWIPNIRWPPKVNLVDFRMLQEGRIQHVRVDDDGMRHACGKVVYI